MAAASSDPSLAHEPIGFVGLGRMGRPMVHNILKAGIHVSCFVRDPAKAQAMGLQGASFVQSLPLLGTHTLIVSMVTDDKALEDVLFGEGRLASTMQPGSLFVSMSFNSPEYVAQLTARLSQQQISFVSAPVFGRPEAAEAGKLLVVAAGAEKDVARCAHVFAAVGRKTVPVGLDPQAGALTKLVGNFLIASVIESFSEAAVLGRKSGLQDDAVAQLVHELFAPNGLNFNGYMARIQSGVYDKNVGAAVSIGLKDLGLMRAQADRVKCSLPLADIHHMHLREAAAHGHEGWDWTAVGGVVAEHAGIRLGKETDSAEVVDGEKGGEEGGSGDQ